MVASDLVEAIQQARDKWEALDDALSVVESLLDGDEVE
jgi:hypothetical protein